MVGLEHQLRKCPNTNLAEKAAIYAQTADYYGLSMDEFANPFISEEERSVKTPESVAADREAQRRLECVKRAWALQAEDDQKRRKITISIVATISIIAVGSLLYYWSTLLGGRP
jgi:hypothetical protein